MKSKKNKIKKEEGINNNKWKKISAHCKKRYGDYLLVRQRIIQGQVTMYFTYYA